MNSFSRNRLGQVIVPGLLALLVVAAAGCNKLKTREHLNNEVRPNKQPKCTSTIKHSKPAIDLNPQFPVARLYLATAYANQFVPGAESADNMKMGQQAVDEFKKVLQDDPN